jgi:outer membrane protein
MKKIIVAGAFILSGILAASAQGKIGYINTEELINVMPEADVANGQLQTYQQALVQQGNEYLQEFNEKDSTFNADSSKMSPAIKDFKRKDLIELYQKVQGWNQTMQQMLGDKQQALLKPIHDKALESIKSVAKENGYTYIIDASALIVSPPADDILPLVKKKLGIPANKTAPLGANPNAAPNQ